MYIEKERQMIVCICCQPPTDFFMRSSRCRLCGAPQQISEEAVRCFPNDCGYGEVRATGGYGDQLALRCNYGDQLALGYDGQCNHGDRLALRYDGQCNSGDQLGQ